MERKLKKLSEEQALSRLAAQCARAEYCLADMRQKMQSWELPDGAEERILNQLVKEGYVDEQRFAQAFVRDKFRYNHWGSRRIGFELRKKNIDETIIEDALGEIDTDSADATLTALLEQKLRSTKGKTDYEVFLKLLRYSVGRGYSPDQAHRCLTKIIKEDPETL